MNTDWNKKAEFVCPDCNYTEITNPSFLTDFFAPEMCPKCSFEPSWIQRTEWIKHVWKERRVRSEPFLWRKPSSWFGKWSTEIQDDYTY